MNRLFRILLKTILILAVLLAGYYLLQPEAGMGNISFYNSLLPGRERLPFGENPRTAYNFSLSNLNAMFKSHEISATGASSEEEIRVAVLGDSSVWGTLLRPDETLAGHLDGKSLQLNGTSFRLKTYNLGYPTLSLSKDLLLLNRALAYQPDLILWPLTMESFPIDKQLTTPLAADNLNEMKSVFLKAGSLPGWFEKTRSGTDWRGKTFFAQRRSLWDLIRLQLYGISWAATRIDQDYPTDYPVPTLDFQQDNTFHSVPGIYPNKLMAWEVLDIGKKIAADVPILLINEPMLISDGQNSNIRYNFYYPVEAYDAWRLEFLDRCKTSGWNCQDFWNILPKEAFTNSAIHYNSNGAAILADHLLDVIQKLLNQQQIYGP